MKIRLLTVSVLLLLASAAVVHADTTPVDPRMAITDPECDSCGVGPVFSFSSDANGGGFFTFQNFLDDDTSVDWTSLLITAQTDILAANVTASSVQFQNVSVSNVGDLLEIFFSGVSAPGCELGCFPGIPVGQVFTIELNDVSGVDGGGWGPGLPFTATANAPVPEPATLTLLGIGLTALAAKLKFRGKSEAEDADPV